MSWNGLARQRACPFSTRRTVGASWSGTSGSKSRGWAVDNSITQTYPHLPHREKSGLSTTGIEYKTMNSKGKNEHSRYAQGLLLLRFFSFKEKQNSDSASFND